MACSIILRDYDNKIIKQTYGGATKIVRVDAAFGYKRCSDDTDYGRWLGADPASQILLLHTGTPNSSNDKLVKCYFDKCTLVGSEINCLIEPDNAGTDADPIPIDCDDTFTAQEDFSAGATIPCRFAEEATGSATIAHAAGYVTCTVVARWGVSAYLADKYPPIGTTEDYELQVKLSNLTGTVNKSSSNGYWLYTSSDNSALAGGMQNGIRAYWDTTTSTYRVQGKQSGNTASLSTMSSYVLFRLRRINGTVYEDYNIDGSGWTTLGTVSSDTTNVVKSVFGVRTGSFNSGSARFTDHTWSTAA